MKKWIKDKWDNGNFTIPIFSFKWTWGGNKKVKLSEAKVGGVIPLKKKEEEEPPKKK